MAGQLRISASWTNASGRRRPIADVPLVRQPVNSCGIWGLLGVEWLRRYHANLLQRIYTGSLYGGAEKLDFLWPTFIGGGIFAVVDIGLKPTSPFRLVVLAILIGPGALWLLYVLFHEARSLPGRLRRHKGDETGE
jgi:hypothetical protein